MADGEESRVGVAGAAEPAEPAEPTSPTESVSPLTTTEVAQLRTDARSILAGLDRDQLGDLGMHLYSFTMLKHGGYRRKTWVEWPQHDAPQPVSSPDPRAALDEALDLVLQRTVKARIQEEDGLEMVLEPEPSLPAPLKQELVDTLELMLQHAKTKASEPINWTNIPLSRAASERLHKLYDPEELDKALDR